MKKNAQEKKAAEKMSESLEKKDQERDAVARVKKAAKAQPKKEGSDGKDQYGFRVGTKRSELIAELAAGQTKKEARKKYDMLSFTKTLGALTAHGFKVTEGSDGKCSVTGKLKA